MKIIILAAGSGTRLQPLTNDMPKCLVKVCGRSILDYQISSIKAMGIPEKDIIILSGYKGKILEDIFRNQEINVIKNTEFAHTNMLYTLMCAKKILEKENEVIVCYGDIIYDISVLKKIINESLGISVVVDIGWKEYWKERFENPLEDAESLEINQEGNIISIGKKEPYIDKIQAQFIGMMKFKGESLQVICSCYDALKNQKKTDLVIKNYRTMFMTDFLQYLIDSNKKMKAVEIERGWYEIDTIKDIEVAEKGIHYLDFS